MCEPLKGKINYELLIYSDYDNFGSRDKVIKQWQDFAKEIKSAKEGLLKAISILPQPCDKDKVYDLVEEWFYDV